MQQLINGLKNILGKIEILKGGEGSGNFGHSGRIGEVGGSGEGGGNSKLTEARNKKYLEGKTEELNKLVSEGWKPVAKDIRDVVTTRKLENQLEHLKEVAPWGNENHPLTIKLNEVKQQLENGVYKKSYRLERGDVIRDITKIEYDYLINKK